MLLSICIPSYNRLGELRKLLNSIAKAKSQDFEVFVIDNCSKEDIFSLGIDDNRIHIIRREKEVNAFISGFTSLDYGTGTYIMTCLDKDFIMGEFLDRFLIELAGKKIACGYCELNSKNEDGYLVVNDINNKKNIYRCGHPSGTFFRKDIIEKNKEILDPRNTSNICYNNPFLIDLMYAQGLKIGADGVYYGKLIKTEPPQKAAVTKSYTYCKKEENLFFIPENWGKTFFVFINHMNIIGIDFAYKKNIVPSLFRQFLQRCTIGYKSVMKNENICAHYGIECRDISIIELVKYGKIFSWQFLKNDDIELSKYEKIQTVCIGWFVILMKIIIGR